MTDNERKEIISALRQLLAMCPFTDQYGDSIDADPYFDAVETAIELLNKTGWIPISKGMPKHSYTKRFWLTVKLDDGTITTLIGTWGAWGGKGSKPYDAFDCWKDVMINGGIYRMSQPIPKEQVLAWMPAPESYKEDGEE